MKPFRHADKVCTLHELKSNIPFFDEQPSLYLFDLYSESS